VHTPECGRCSAWLNESLALYLRRKYPEAFHDYALRLQAIAATIGPSVQNLQREMGAVAKAVQIAGVPEIPTRVGAGERLAPVEVVEPA
jgi:hypothetical protein